MKAPAAMKGMHFVIEPSVLDCMGGILESADDQPAYDLQGREVPVNSANGVIIINNEKLLSR